MRDKLITLKNYRQKLGDRAYGLLGEVEGIETHEQAIDWQQRAEYIEVMYRLYEMLERKGQE